MIDVKDLIQQVKVEWYSEDVERENEIETIKDQAYARGWNACQKAIISNINDMTIKALEQEPCEDCISRKALIERINHAEENFKADNMESIGSDDGDPFVDGVLSGVFNIREMVIQAPSVTPQEYIH